MPSLVALAPIHFPPDGMVMNSFWQPFMTYVNVIPIVAACSTSAACRPCW